MNKKFVDVYGWLYPDGQIIGKNGMSSICPHDHSKVMVAVRTCVAEPGRLIKVEIDKPAIDGSILTTIWDFICLTDHEGAPSEMQCMGIDITDRIQAERTLKESVERFEIITRATNDAIWDYEVEKGRLFRGYGFMTMFGHETGYTNAEHLELLQMAHPDDRNWLSEQFTSMFQKECTDTNWEVEYRLCRADGTYAYVIERAVFIRNADGEVVRIVGATSDLTHRHEYEESLKKLNSELERNVRKLALSNQDLEQFAYVTSHDLQEPLRMVSSFLTLLEKRYGHQLDEIALQYIHFATDGAKRMRQIILDLLDLSKVGNYDEPTTSVSLNEVVSETLSLYRRLITEKDAVISVGDLPIVTYYRTPIAQIFQNLVSNAIKYSKKGEAPHIEIKAIEHNLEHEIVISDNGIGISPEYHDTVFVLFQRLNTESEYSGTGIGLPIVKKILDRLGGRIWVDSDEGKGSKFHFTIPKIVYQE